MEAGHAVYIENMFQYSYKVSYCRSLHWLLTLCSSSIAFNSLVLLLQPLALHRPHISPLLCVLRLSPQPNQWAVVPS